MNKTFINFELTTKEQSIKLKEFGLIQNRSLFYYNPNQLLPIPCTEANDKVDIAAFTSSQLGYFIPDEVIRNDKTFVIEMKRNKAIISFNGDELQTIEGISEVDIRSKLLLVLLEAKLLSIDDINKKAIEFGYNYRVPF
jgi:hypothetical protein